MDTYIHTFKDIVSSHSAMMIWSMAQVRFDLDIVFGILFIVLFMPVFYSLNRRNNREKYMNEWYRWRHFIGFLSKCDLVSDFSFRFSYKLNAAQNINPVHFLSFRINDIPFTLEIVSFRFIDQRNCLCNKMETISWRENNQFTEKNAIIDTRKIYTFLIAYPIGDIFLNLEIFLKH